MSLIEKFKVIYPEAKDIGRSFCPYRVCPVGAHSDHQYGMISGFAIDKGVEVIYSPSESGLVEVSSLNFEGKKVFNLERIVSKENDWADYLRGTTKLLHEEYGVDKGIKCLINGELPIGGLSSSAAVILSFMSAMCKVNNLKLPKDKIIDLAERVETKFIGVSIGKMDQSCEMYCKKDNLFVLDTKTGEYKLIPKSDKMPAFQIGVFFSGMERSLVGSKFNMRVDELKAAAYSLLAFSGKEYGKFQDTRLRDVPKEVFKEFKDELPLNWKKRATHYYTEFDRVLEGAKAWENGDLKAFGHISFESGESSINNYESGSDELITLHNIINSTPGVYGGRFSGGGFKGCCVALIDPAKKQEIEEHVTKEYLKVFPQYKNTFKIDFCNTTDGCDF